MARLPALLALAILAPFATASPYDASPRVGDAAEYVLVSAGGTRHVLLEWRADAVLLPTGEERVLATLRATVRDADPPRASATRSLITNPFTESGLLPPAPEVASLHWTTPGFGPAAAWSAQWLDETDGDRRWATRVSLGGCSAQTWLLAWADEACGFEGTIGRGSGNGLPGAVSGEGWRMDLVAARRGDEPLPASPPFARPARLPLVDWGREGPASGDLREGSFADARRALLAQEAAAARFFVESPDARILYARHAWATTAALGDEAWRDRIKGVPCAAAGAERAPGGEWSSAWIGRDGSLFALVQRLGTTPPLFRALDASRDSYSTTHVGGLPTTRAPSPAALAAQVALLPEAHGEVATMEIDLHPTAPTASVSRGTCARDPATGRLGFTGASILFEDGLATGTLVLEAEREREPILLGLGAPGAPFSSSPRAPPSADRASAAVVAAGGFAALVAAAAFYSRIRRKDALAHAKRALVHEHVRAFPGGSIQDAARALGLPRNTVEHHVRTLARNGYLDVREGAHGKALWASGSPPGPHERLLAREHARALLDAVGASPGITQNEVARRLGMRKSHLSTLARDLEAEGLLRRRREGRTVALHPAGGGAARRGPNPL